MPACRTQGPLQGNPPSRQTNLSSSAQHRHAAPQLQLHAGAPGTSPSAPKCSHRFRMRSRLPQIPDVQERKDPAGSVYALFACQPRSSGRTSCRCTSWRCGGLAETEGRHLDLTSFLRSVERGTQQARHSEVSLISWALSASACRSFGTLARAPKCRRRQFATFLQLATISNPARCHVWSKRFPRKDEPSRGVANEPPPSIWRYARWHQSCLFPGAWTNWAPALTKQSGPWTYGALWNQVSSFSGDPSRSDVNQMFPQPFLAYQATRTVTLTLQSESTLEDGQVATRRRLETPAGRYTCAGWSWPR